MFSSPEMAQNLTWHAQGRANNGMLSHLRDSPSWKLVDRTWKEFGEEKRNLRLALSADGINPHKSLSSKHSCPKQPGNNIDVYLAPLIADLKLLWETGVKTYDAYKKEYFNLRAILLCTINDFPAHDVMHIEKNVCESVYGTLLNLPGKTKDGLRARQDLEAMGIKPELQTQPRGNRIWLLPACYTLNTTEKHQFYKTLSTIKVPDGYCLNFKNLMSDDGVLHVKVRKTIIEKYIPPSFFDVMIHLMVHLVREVRLCGPVHFRWMYPFERYMKTLKGYVRNHHRPEGCIAECYMAEEALEFCSDYLKNMKSIGNPHEHVDERIHTGKPLSRGTVEVVDAKLLDEAHLYIVSAKDSNPVYGAVTYYGRIQEICDLDYRIFTVRVFMCDWVDSRGIKKDDFGFTVVNFARLDHQFERFILASPAKQVFYVQDQQDANLFVVGFTPNKMYKYGANGETDDMLEYHVVLGTMESDQSSSHDEDSKHKGPTIKGKTTKGKVIVTYNKKGVPIGVEATKLASFEGIVARSMVSITYATWRDVEQEKKEDLWQYILEISEKAKKMRGQYRYNHRLSRKGYAGLTLEIMQEMGKEEDKIDRALLWKKARQMKKGGYDPNVQIIVDKMEEMQKSETLREVSCGTNDMLTQALGTQEQRGRVRGMGKFVRPHQYFVLPNTVKKYLDGEKKKFEKRFNQIEGTIEKLQKGMNHASEGASCQGWGKADFEDNPPEELLVIAKGTIVKHNDLSVMMEMSVQGDASLPFPLDEEFIYKVKDAVGFIVKWPRHLVIRCSDLSVKVQCEDDMFGYESFTYITWEDFEVVFTVDEMTGSMITCYMMYLFEEIKNGPKRDHGICFMSPSAISPSGRKAKFKNSDEAIQSVADRLSLRKDNDIILVPYNPGRHWLLAQIDMKATSCYYLDSLGPTNVHQQLKQFIDAEMKLYNAQSGSNKKCPRQSGGIECGYYVCKFMKEIVENGLQVLVNKNVGDGKEEYTDDDIDDIRKEWLKKQSIQVYGHPLSGGDNKVTLGSKLLISLDLTSLIWVLGLTHWGWRINSSRGGTTSTLTGNFGKNSYEMP
ncbi:hypothetical protein F3Y22_tig00111843pilonHSYRG00019 [Hibiscus syriacus]|uniref:Ubiquitin-like protease family profile domain-containing protein n=1 Tax=Hibiscus syriacus TaxID=106335 RepID=A0A6A2YFK8_HIBSY|nr:hypothetical protein F3Y22_tig00111843pilonHSYRG00019 [Hibiscus syriacus]